MSRSISYCLVIVFLLPLSLYAQTPTPTPPPSAKDRGTTIGTTVRAALDVAFPGAGTLAETLINAAAEKIKMKKAEKEQALAAATEAAKKTEKQAATASHTQLKALDVLATQLDVVIQFADASSTANEYIIPLISYLDTHANPNEDEWTANVKTQWDIISKNLKPLEAYDTSVLNIKVKDGYVKDLLHQIVIAQNTRVVELAGLIKEKPQTGNIPRIRQKLAELQPILSNIGRVATLQVQTLASDLHDVAAPKEQQSVGKEAEKERKERFDAISTALQALSIKG